MQPSLSLDRATETCCIIQKNSLCLHFIADKINHAMGKPNLNHDKIVSLDCFRFGDQTNRAFTHPVFFFMLFFLQDFGSSSSDADCAKKHSEQLFDTINYFLKDAVRGMTLGGILTIYFQ